MSLKYIELNFVNRSADMNNSSIVIFQKNVAADLDELTVAWIVIKNCGRLNYHPFIYLMQMDVSASDSYGNYTPHMPAPDGHAFEMVEDFTGDVLQRARRPAQSPSEVEVRNNLETGAITANFFKDGKLVAAKTGIAPAQKAVIEIQPIIYIGVVSQITQGAIIEAAIIQQIHRRFDLTGITKADIVMTGGGPGRQSMPFEFHLHNVFL
jgi:hypothetical protein